MVQRTSQPDTSVTKFHCTDILSFEKHEIPSRFRLTIRGIRHENTPLAPAG
jgi:hypothetical protein